jgi:hypothetical protein
MWALYGDPGYKNEAMMHRWCYSAAEVCDMLQSAGLSVVEERPKTHISIRDMRIVGTKAWNADSTASKTAAATL